MSRIARRLKNIKYQLIRGVVLSDESIVSAIRSIYDAAIKEDTVIPEEYILPTQIMGATIVWSNDKKQIKITKNAITIQDDLTDSFVPSVDYFENFLMVNDDFLMVDGDYFMVNTSEAEGPIRK